MTTDKLPDILPLRPYLREMVWGGRRLGTLLGKSLPPAIPVGESFEISALPERDCVVSSGPLCGRGLRGLLGEFGADLVGPAVTDRYGDDFPLLIKLIDAQDDLSIQVHPDDSYARNHDLGVFGKTEAWYVLHSDEGRIALGLESGVDATQLAAAISAGRAQEVVTFESVSPGDVVYLPAGTVHALCRGVVIYEVQQSSDITFRLYDYDRPGLDGNKRELHVDAGIAVTDFVTPRPQLRRAPDTPGRETLIDADYFRLDSIGGHEVEIDTAPCFAAITVIAGAIALNGATGSCKLTVGSSALIPVGRQIHVSPLTPHSRCLVATPAL